MKKILAVLLVCTMILGLTACGNSSGSGSSGNGSSGGNGSTEKTTEKIDPATDASKSTAAATDAQGLADVQAETKSGDEGQKAAAEGTDGRPTVGNGKIGMSTITLGQEFFSNLDMLIHNRLESAGYEVVTVSCEGNAATQVSDIENLITMNCEAIFFFAVDPDAIKDVCKKGREAGIKMYGMACTMDDTDAYDKIINTDQYSAGLADAEMAAEWIDKTFPDAQDGSIDVAVVGLTGTVDGNNRTEGEKMITELTSKANVVEIYDLTGVTDSNIKTQEYAEMMQSKYPDLKCIIAYGCDSALGANEVYMRKSDLNRDEFAIFGVDTSEAIYNQINLSKTNDSLIRGTVSLGDDLSLDVWECLIDADLEYMDENRCIYKPVKKITTENIADYLNE